MSSKVEKPKTGSLSRRRQVALFWRLLLLVVVLVYALFPVVWIFSASLDPANSLSGQQLIPRNATLANYTELLRSERHPYLQWMGNSLRISTTTAILGLFLTALASYAFSRFRFRGRRSLLQTILLIQVFPNFLNMVALFLLLQQLGRYELTAWLGLNTHGGLILLYLGGVLGINTWLMKGYFDSIPRDLDESAMMDGATHWQSFRYVILPLVQPILVVVGLLTFITTYSEFVLARVMLQSPGNYTLAVGLSLFIRGQFTQRWGQFAAGALLGALPIVVIFLLLQQYLVSGLTAGAVKG
jgi:arabinogalactan oligomer / maltooligosaccharide transport system permease protein